MPAERAGVRRRTRRWRLARSQTRRPEVATIGQLARTVQRLIQARGGWVRIQGAASSEATFKSTLAARRGGLLGHVER